MEKVLIDLFSVPESARDVFAAMSHRAQSIVKTLPGFVEGYSFEQAGSGSRYNYITIAVWESQEAYERAKAAIPGEYQKHGFNPQETLKRLNIEPVRALYDRSPY